MRKNFFATGFISSATVIASALAVIYSAGRWDYMFIPEFLAAKVFGIMSGIVVCYFLLKIDKERKLSRCLGAYCILIGFSLLFLVKSSNLLQKVYFAGYEQAVFSAGSVQQWESLVVYMSDSYAKGIDWRSKPLPDFVQRVYPGQSANVALMSMKPGTNDYVAVIWRGVSFDRVLMIGQISSEEFSHSNETYWKQYSKTILFKITGG